MRFIRQEEIITTICNKEVTESSHIIGLLNRLKEERLYFSLSIRKMFHSDYTDRTITYAKTKVKNVNEDEEKVDFLVYKETSLINVNNVSFDEISEIFALTRKKDLLTYNQDKGFFDFIDLEE